MVLFAIVAVLENEKTEEAFVSTQVREMKDVEDAELVGEWVFEYAKTQNKQLRINVVEVFQEMHYEIWAKKLDTPYASFFVFTHAGYAESLAKKALGEAEEVFLKGKQGKDDRAVSEDCFESVKGLDRVLTKYYEGIENIDKLNARMDQLIGKAEGNQKKTQDIRDMTSQIKYNARKMKSRATETSDKNACCRVF